VELGTFGAVLKHALELEESATGFYETASTIVTNQVLSEKLHALSERCKKRSQTLLRVRRENVTEMILEPIHGLDTEDYSPSFSLPESPESSTVVELAIALEKKIKEFYNTAGAKLDFLIEVADAFERLADENNDNIQKLQTG
jgi:hypothetical protein